MLIGHNAVYVFLCYFDTQSLSLILGTMCIKIIFGKNHFVKSQHVYLLDMVEKKLLIMPINNGKI